MIRLLLLFVVFCRYEIPVGTTHLAINNWQFFKFPSQTVSIWYNWEKSLLNTMINERKLTGIRKSGKRTITGIFKNREILIEYQFSEINFFQNFYNKYSLVKLSIN